MRMRTAVFALACILPLAACRPAAGPPRSASLPARALPILVDLDMGLDDARVLLALTRQRRYRVEAVTTVEDRRAPAAAPRTRCACSLQPGWTMSR